MSLSRWQAERLARIIRAGGVIAYPTEAVFGLGCDPLNPAAVYRILDLKKRSVSKGLILVGANFDQLKPYLAPLPESIERKMLDSWPGPTTWLAPAMESAPTWLRGEHSTLAIRVSDHPRVKELCRVAGMALVSTSANPGNRPPARTAIGVRGYFGDQLDAIVSGATGGNNRPSSIIDAMSGQRIRI